jgi:hypothetical protein
MIKLTNDNINSAIVSKGYNIVQKNTSGYILTNETICTFNSLIVFKELFKNKCKMLDSALENLYYIADRLINCNDDGGGGDQPTPSDKYYTIIVSTNKSAAKIYINGIERSFATFQEGTKNIQIVATCDGYVNKTYTISNLTRDYNVYLEFTAQDVIPVTRYSVIVNCNVSDATIEINGIERSYAQVEAGSDVSIRAYKEGYNTFETTIENISKDEVIDATLTEVAPGRVTLKLNLTPSNAHTNIYNRNTGVHYINVRSVTVDAGTVVDITVTASGYNTYTENGLVLNSNVTKTIVLTEAEAPKYTLHISPTPSNAIVSLKNMSNGGIYGNDAQFYGGTQVLVTVSADGYEPNGFTYTIDPEDAVDGVITKLVSLVHYRNVTFRVFSDALHTQALSGFNLELEDIITEERLYPVSTVNPNEVIVRNCLQGRTYNVRVNKGGYHQEDSLTFTVSGTDGQTVDIYMKANTYKLKVVVCDADDNNNPIQSATVLINGSAVTYSGGESEEIDIQAGTQVEIEASASGYQTVPSTIITMPFENHTENIYLSASVATVNVTVVNYADNSQDITSNCVIKINGNTGNNQTISLGTARIEVSYNEELRYVSYAGNKNITSGTNNITIELVPYIHIACWGRETVNNVNNGKTVVMNFEEGVQNDIIVRHTNVIYDGETIVNGQCDLYVPYGNDIFGYFVDVDNLHDDVLINRSNIVANEGIYIYFEKKYVKLTIKPVANGQGSIIYMDEPSNIVHIGDEIYVLKGSRHKFVATMQGYIDGVWDNIWNIDTNISLLLYTPIYVHVVDMYNTPVINANIEIYDNENPDEIGENIYDGYGGSQISNGVYYVEYYDTISANVIVSGNDYITVEQNNRYIQGETHFYITLQDQTEADLTIRVKNSANDNYINDATIYVDGVVIQNNPVRLNKGNHTVKVEKSGFGTVTQTINLQYSTTIFINIKPTLTAHIHGYKSDVSPAVAYNGVHVVYLIGDSTIPQIVNNTDQNITYELPYNTNIKVNVSATGYDAVEQTFRFTEETLEAFINIPLAGGYTLTINVVDDDTDDPIDNANVTFNVE